MDTEQLTDVISGFKSAIRNLSGTDVPNDPWLQLKGVVKAVFSSWNTTGVTHYREYFEIPHDLRTAVTIMSRMYGNIGIHQRNRVLFTRNPSTGEKKVYGEFLPNVQGEDIVAVLRTSSCCREHCSGHGL